MNTPEFKSFDKIENLTKLTMHITQKIHGTNASILIYKDGSGVLQLMTGSRTRWVYPHDDNYGFATFVHSNKDTFIELLGPGYHPGEWAGLGINSGEGLSEKTFVLFDHWKWPPGRALPPRTTVVPVLYSGPVDASKIQECMDDLRTNGSKLAPGFMRPEGIVVQIQGNRYKKVFDAEETQWTKPQSSNAGLNKKEEVDFSHLLQPIRLEKLLSRDERYAKQYPESLSSIAKDYIQDLVDEKQIDGDDSYVKSIRKACSGQVFRFIKTFMESSGA